MADEILISVAMSKSIISLIFTEKYTVERKLGEGTFASVYEAVNNENNEHYAVKQIYVQKPFLQDVKD